MKRARVIGTGSFLPPFIVTNEDLCKFFPADDRWNASWIDEKLGIRERRFAYDFQNGRMREGYYDLDLGERAARAALASARIGIETVDAILYATSTPEYYMPDPACSLHLRLGAREDTAATGLTSVGCAGMVYLMILGNALIASGQAGTVLLVGAASPSSYYDPGFAYRDRLNASLFGDGAGALILQATEGQSGILHTCWGADGHHNPMVFEGGGSRHPASRKTVENGMHHFRLNGKAVKEIGPLLFEKTVQTILQKAQVSLAEIACFVFHQVNSRLLRVIADRLRIPWERMAVHVDRYGNTNTASLAIGFDEEFRAGRVTPGGLVLFAAIGAGWQYGAVLLRF